MSQPLVKSSYMRGLGKSWDQINSPAPIISFIMTPTPATEPTRLPRPRALMHNEVIETNGSFRPVIEAVFVRRFFWHTRTSEFAFYGGAWVAKVAAGKAVKR